MVMKGLSKEQWIAVSVALVVVAIFFIGSMLFFAPSPASEINTISEGQTIEGSDTVDMVVENVAGHEGAAVDE